MADIKSLLAKIGLGAAATGAVAANVATGGAIAPVTAPLIQAIAAKLDPSVKNQFDLAVQQAQNDLDKVAMEHDTSIVVAVNQTMQTEAKSEHWLQWAWRPIFGLSAAAVIVNNYILLPYFAKAGLQPITVPGDVWNVMLAVLGLSALTRGIEKTVSASKNGNGGN